MKYIVLFFILISFVRVASSEETQNYLLDEVQIQGLKELDIFDFSLENQSRSVSIIKEKELEKSGTGSILNILDNTPGIVFQRNGGINGRISFRGGLNNRSISTLDGVRITSRSTLKFNTFDPNSIDSVEIIRGPASSLYGSDAMNGVINFKSRRYKGDVHKKEFDIHTRIKSLEYSSVNSMFATRLEALGGGKGFDVLFGLALRKARDYHTPLGIAKNSKYNALGLDFNVGYMNDEGTRYYLQGKFSKIHSYRAGGFGAVPGSSYGVLMEENPILEYYLRAGLEGENLSFADSYNAYVYWRHWDTDIYTDRRALNGSYIHQNLNNENFFGSKFTLKNNFQKHNIIYGIEYLASILPSRWSQKLGSEPKTTRRPSQTHTFSSFIKDDYSFTESLLLSASLRGDYVLARIGKKRYYNESPQDTFNLDNAGNITNKALTGSLGAVYHLNEFFSVFTNLSHNFKAPSVGQMMQTTPGGNASEPTIANTNLKSEYSQSLELGTRFESENASFALAGFYTQYSDMISLSDLMSDGTSFFRQYINIGKANIRGLEFEGAIQLSRLTLASNISATYGQDESNNRPLSYIAPLYGKFSADYTFDWGDIELVQKAYKGKTRINVKEERKTKSYTLSNVYTHLDLGYFKPSMKDMSLTLGIENVFNTKARNPATAENIAYARSLTNPLLEPGRNFFVRFGYKY
ncbi:TonB-dependent receptor [Campylobacter sp. MIT 21-1682]|uniref:TonB-dependent receptor n=1 Tax=Campylobacter sp. MIT 21-1682 TaxID=2993734 RepID=UPI00224AC610|nr:TonB-dependent receptor [Campylobacter sp. MIT 21-1682]MCX2752158.1 TonB-dependent receptor [Campylobacter sp. MIT 21-1682]